MPIYMPWLTVSSAVIALIACTTTINCWLWALPLYIATFMSLLCIKLLRIVQLEKAILFLALMPLLAYIYTKHFLPTNNENDLGLITSKVVVLRATLLEKPKVIAPKSNVYAAIALTSKLLFPEPRALSTKVQLFITLPSPNLLALLEQGQSLEIKGIVKNLTQSQEPWLSGLDNLSRRGVRLRLYTSNNKITFLNSRQPGLPKKSETVCFIDHLRRTITNQHLNCLGVKAGSLLASMVLGDHAVALDAHLLESFRKVGLSHIVAASGFNLTIVTIITYWILRRLLTNRLLITIIVCLNVVFYALLAGLSASIIRSAIACLLILLVKLNYRKTHRFSALALVLLINLAFDPTIVMDLGAQLSYAAVTCIIVGAEPLTKLLSFGFKSKIMNVFSGSLAVVLLAQAAVLPIQLYHFWQSSFLFLPANLLVDPLVSPVTIIGFIASFAGLLDLGSFHFFGQFCYFLDLLVSVPLNIIIFLTEKLAASKYSSINIGQPSLSSLSFYYFSLAILLYCLSKIRYRLFALILFSASLIVLFYKANLDNPLIIFLSHSTIAINQQRQAICIGSESNKTKKILSFYGTKIIEKPFTAEKAFLFKLRSKPDIFILAKEQAQSPYFILSVQTKNNMPAKRYFIDTAEKRTEQKLSVPLKKNNTLSLNELRSEIQKVDIKTCCNSNSVQVMILTEPNPHAL